MKARPWRRALGSGLLAALGLGLVLTGPVVAEPVRLELSSDPSGALVTDQYGNKLGLTGAPFQLDLGSYGSTLEVTLTLDGYEPKLERIKTRQLSESGRYPPEGAVALRATSFAVTIKTFAGQHPAALAVSGLLVAAAAVAGGTRHRQTQRQLGRATILESMRARGEALEDNLIGSRLGAYRLVDLLGEGGTARVYRAVPEATLDHGQAVAVKVLQPPSEHDPEFRQRFAREVSIWKGLQHPNVVSFLDWDEQDGLTYLVTELLEGRTLRVEFEGRARSPKEALALLQPLFAALSFAHGKGVVHRDLKPENVLLTAQGRLKVTDFGLARMGPEDKVTRTGTWVGTPEYMAPEQVRGGAVDPRTDQYALGIMLYELVAGKPPFHGQDQVTIIFQQVSSAPPSLLSLKPDLPPPFCAAVTRMLAKQPEQRFADLEQAYQALEASSG